MKKTCMTLVFAWIVLIGYSQSTVLLPQQSTVFSSSPAMAAFVAGNSATTGVTTIGIQGSAGSFSGGYTAAGVSGVFGILFISNPGAFSAGVRGVNYGTGTNGAGVIGHQTGSGWGVYGETPSGYGVYGLTTHSTAQSVGVRGEVSSPNAIAVEAKYSGTGIGTALEVDNGAIRVAGTNKSAFTHTATVANKANNYTTIDHPLCNGDPNCLLFVTQKFNPLTGTYNNSPIGVFFDQLSNKWGIFNENSNSIPNDAQFNVLVIKQ